MSHPKDSQRKNVQQHCKHCKTSCQLFKTSGKKKDGEKPAKTAEITKCGSLGTSNCHEQNETVYNINNKMTMIDPAIGWLEVAALKNGTNTLKAQRIIDSQLLDHNSRSREIQCDGSSWFKAEFLELCIKMDTK